MLRYEIGDLATPDAAACPCGRPGRIVSSIDGRQEDYLTLPSGVRIGRLDHIFKDMVNVREAQFVQFDRHKVTLRIARGATYTDHDQELLLGELQQRIGTELQVNVEYVDVIPRGPNGKLRLVLSSVPKY
jgi:phenylacetate-CoA ligase